MLHLASAFEWPYIRTAQLSSFLTPPAVFLGLLVTLWAYKSLMLVIFQNKIIYMPSVPPFSRSEKIEDYAASCRPVVWREERIRAADGTKLALALGEIPGRMRVSEGTAEQVLGSGRRRRVVIVYFQGNGASLPPRLPALSSILRSLNTSHTPTAYTLVALSYRGFWTSSGRASEPGIKLDATAALSWVVKNFLSGRDSDAEDVNFVLWGQSLGAGVAVDAAATAISKSAETSDDQRIRLDGLLLETPFVSVKAMLLELYPQKWLPYRYLGVFLRNHWDSREALQRIARSSRVNARPERSLYHQPLKLLVLQAGKDELVPASQAVELESCARNLGLDVRRVEVKGALHNEVSTKGLGKEAILGYLREIADVERDCQNP